MAKTALILRHVAFEDLGTFDAVLHDAGYDVRYCEMGVEEPRSFGEADLLVVLGGPIGAYEDDIYPFLKDEIALIAEWLKAREPVLGICLGAQLMARALGARVYPGPAKEIGWKKLILTDEGQGILAPLAELPVLHWHGDTFDLPDGAVNLASTDICRHQAFAVGHHALAFQFHPEALQRGFERWLIGHACEIAGVAGLSVPQLRADTKSLAPATEQAGKTVLRNWLSGLNR